LILEIIKKLESKVGLENKRYEREALVFIDEVVKTESELFQYRCYRGKGKGSRIRARSSSLYSMERESRHPKG